MQHPTAYYFLGYQILLKVKRKEMEGPERTFPLPPAPRHSQPNTQPTQYQALQRVRVRVRVRVRAAAIKVCARTIRFVPKYDSRRRPKVESVEGWLCFLSITILFLKPSVEQNLLLNKTVC